MADFPFDLELQPDEYDEELPPIETLPDGLVAIGESVQAPQEEPQLREFDDNLAEDMSDEELLLIAKDLIAKYDVDQSARDDWMSVYEKGLLTLRPEELGEGTGAATRSSRNMSTVHHPLLAETATQFQARAISELFPPSGPVGTVILGEATEELQNQATRVSIYMNYQLTEEMEEYFPDLDQMLFHLPLVGQTFKKCYFNPVLGRITSSFVQGADLVIDADATSLATAMRTTETIRITSQQYDEYVATGFYLEATTATEETTSDDAETMAQKVTGITTPASSEDDMVVLREAHCYLDVESKSEPNKPFVVTYFADTQQVVGVRRNWDVEDEKRFKKQVWYVSYKFLPGLGFYGYGLYHVIGGLGKAATGALRSLLDSAAFANLQGGFKLKGRMQGGEIEVAPGEFADIDAVVDDINKAIMPLPFKEPSQTMMALLQYVVEVGKRFANTADMNIADANQNTPVGTTMALLEENARVFSAIHKRLHNAQRQEFQLIAKLNGIYLPTKYPFRMKGVEDSYILAKDFDNRIDIIPTSDPSTFSSTQRIAQGQATMQMENAAPELYNKYVVHKRMHEALRTPNYEEFLLDPLDIERMDPVTENTAIMFGHPTKAYSDQDHKSHMIVLDNWYSRLPPEGQQLYQNQYIGHRAEHMALLYRAQVQAALGAPLPPLQDFKNPNERPPDIDPTTDAKIAEAAAHVINNSAQGQKPAPLGPPLPKMGGDKQPSPLEQARLMMQIESESIQMKTKADIESKMMKAQMDAQIKQSNAQMDMQIEQIKAQAKLEEARIKAQFSAETDQQKATAEVELMWAKANADIQIAREKADTYLQGEMARINTQIAMEEERTENQMELDRAKARTDQHIRLVEAHDKAEEFNDDG